MTRSILPNVDKKVRFGSIETKSILPNVDKKVRFGKIKIKKFTYFQYNN
jgi:hypothetical protein